METIPTPSVKQSRARFVFGVPGMTALVIVILGGFFAAAFYATSFLTSGQMASVISATLVDLTNGDRQEDHLATLTVNPLLTKAAQAKADDMAAKGYFAHVTPEGYEPWYFFTQAGYDYAAAGENLAVNFSESSSVEKAWMNSPGHRANILNGRFTEIGIATAVGEYEGKKTTFVVEEFGTPRTEAAPAPTPTKETIPTNPEEPAVVAAAPSDVLGTETVPAEPIPAAPLPREGAAPAPGTTWYSGLIDRLLVSPETLLQILYILCGALVLVALLKDTELAWRKHHVKQVAAAAFLLVLMGGLLVAADRVVFVDPIVAGVATSGH
jgi:uncharacterized protein YkwD